MATDIVKRLRNVAVLEWCEPMCVEAADEIERLRAECQRLAGEVSRAHRDALAWMERAAAARREGIEAAAQAAENCLHPSAERTAHAAVDDAVGAIRALLEDGR
jgi:hypothetical protein